MPLLPDSINDFITLTSDMKYTIVSVDRDGSAGAHTAKQVLVLQKTGGKCTDAQDMLDQGMLSVV